MFLDQVIKLRLYYFVPPEDFWNLEWLYHGIIILFFMGSSIQIFSCIWWIIRKLPQPAKHVTFSGCLFCKYSLLRLMDIVVDKWKHIKGKVFWVRSWIGSCGISALHMKAKEWMWPDATFLCLFLALPRWCRKWQLSMKVLSIKQRIHVFMSS